MGIKALAKPVSDKASGAEPDNFGQKTAAKIEVRLW